VRANPTNLIFQIMPAHRLPTALKKAKGTYRKDREVKNEPELPIERPAPAFTLHGVGESAFIAFSNVLYEMRVLTAGDSVALTLMADVLSEYIEARRFLNTHGTTYEARTTAGDIVRKPHVEVAIASDAFKRLTAILQQFGMTPASRGKVNATEGINQQIEKWINDPGIEVATLDQVPTHLRAPVKAAIEKRAWAEL
jgi:P27 family predicted phage terminase small subunit